MTDKAKSLLSLTVQRIVRDNQPKFEDIIFNGITEDMDKDQVYAGMILNSITLSVDIAVQIICELLAEADLVNFPTDERLLQKLALQFHTENISR